MRHTFSIKAADYPNIVSDLLNLSQTTPYFQFLDSNEHKDAYHTHKWIFAIGASEIFKPTGPDPFSDLFSFHQEKKDWLFGHINYDLKNNLEDLNSDNPDFLDFPDLLFFIPETVIYSHNDEYLIKSLVYSTVDEFLEVLQNSPSTASHFSGGQLKAKTSKAEYLETVESLKEQLQYGNIYEINYCIEFANHLVLNPLQIFNQLNNLSQAPFMCYYRCNDQYMACASPERYLKKSGQKIISQPIKGTAKRSSDPEIDLQLKRSLKADEKERSENVMIVDLVRNDLSRFASKGSVHVDELFGIYSYPSVHQMISTVSCLLNPETPFTDALKLSFPMGSMTGAPKVKAMQLIDEHEKFSRSLYAGSVGYITPNGDFDFNVVIRSILYNSKTQYTSARVGSAITIHCNAEKEYEECLLKAENLFKALEN